MDPKPVASTPPEHLLEMKFSGYLEVVYSRKKKNSFHFFLVEFGNNKLLP